MATILVTKGTNGNGRFEKRHYVVQQVIAHLRGDRVKTSSGDVWAAKPHKGNEADFIAVK